MRRRAQVGSADADDRSVDEIARGRKRLLGQRLERVRSIEALHALAGELEDRWPAPFARCLFALMHAEVSDKRARHWLERIVVHRERLSRRLARPVALRVAALDLFPPSTRGVGRLLLIPRRRLFAVARWVSEDALTGLKNRRAFRAALKTEIDRSARFDRPLSVVMLDVDDFKRFNDRFGHPAGDDALRLIGRTLRATARSLDTAARYGGEEFALIAPETDERGGRALAERLRRAIADASARSDLPARVTVSLGGATRRGRATADARALVEAADAALYAAKRAGKDRVEWAAEPRRGARRGRVRRG